MSVEQMIEHQKQTERDALRRQYAMAALTGWAANRNFYPDPSDAAMRAFQLADAMMAEELRRGPAK